MLKLFFSFYLLALSPSFCGASNDTVDFKDVKKGLEKKNIVLIDVRSRREFKSLGKIPGAYNFPGIIF